MPNTALQNTFALLARLLIVVLFLPSGLSKLAGFSGTVGYIASAGLPLPALGAVIAILVEVGGGLALLLGVGTRIASVVMAVFTLFAGIFFHAFWSVPADQAMVTQIMFMKNVAIVGGLLALAALGPGAWSIEGRRR